MFKERAGKIVNKLLNKLVGPPVIIPAPQPRDKHGRFANK